MKQKGLHIVKEELWQRIEAKNAKITWYDQRIKQNINRIGSLRTMKEDTTEYWRIASWMWNTRWKSSKGVLETYKSSTTENRVVGWFKMKVNVERRQAELNITRERKIKTYSWPFPRTEYIISASFSNIDELG